VTGFHELNHVSVRRTRREIGSWNGERINASPTAGFRCFDSCHSTITGITRRIPCSSCAASAFTRARESSDKLGGGCGAGANGNRWDGGESRSRVVKAAALPRSTGETTNDNRGQDPGKIAADPSEKRENAPRVRVRRAGPRTGERTPATLATLAAVGGTT